MRRLIERWLPRSRFARGVTLIAGGAAVAQIITVVASPILTRLYEPTDFGILQAYASILGLASVVAAWRYEMAIPLPGDDSEARDVLALALSMVVGTAAVGGIAVWLSSDQLASWLDTPEIGRYAWAVPIGILLVGAYSSMNMWAIRKGAFGRIGRTRLAQASGAVGTQIGAGLAGVRPFGLIVGHIIGLSSGTGTLLRRARNEDGLRITKTGLQRMRAVATRYRRFPLVSSWAALLNAGGLEAPALILLAFYDAELLGWYALALRLLAMPTQLVSRAVSQVFVGESASLVSDRDFRGLEQRFWKTVKGLMLIGLVVIPLLALPAPLYFPPLFGSEWETAGRVAQLLAPFMFASLVAGPLGGVLDVLERQDLHLLREVVRTALSLGTLVLLAAGGADPLVAIAGLSIAGTLGYAFGFFVAWRAVISADRAEAE